jgi:glutathione S-transferase
MAKGGVRFIMRKHAVPVGDETQHEEDIRRALDELRRALAGGALHLTGDSLSYADMTMACALQFILPVDDRYIRLGPATREVWTHHALAREYEDLMAWRDRLYDVAR